MYSKLNSNLKKLNSNVTKSLLNKVLLCSIFVSISAMPIILNASALGPDTWTNLAGHTLTVLDYGKPVIMILNLTGGQTFHTSPIIVDGTVWADAGLSNVTLKVGGHTQTVTVTGGPTWTITSDPIQLAKGQNNITARATDNSSNSDETWVIVNYIPVISITSPEEGRNFTESPINVSGNYSEDVIKVEMKVGTEWLNVTGAPTGTLLAVTGSSSWTYSIQLTDGSNNITARALDTSGNYNQTTVNVIYNRPDNENPVINISYPTVDNVFHTSPITVNGTASDNKGLSKVEVKVGNGSWSIATIDNGSWTVSNISLITEKNNITAKATDTSGNYNETSINVTYIQPGITNPVISIISPSDGDEFNTSSIEVSGTALNNSTFRMVEVKVNNGSWENASGADPWNITVQLSMGSNTIYARANYTASNSNNVSITVIYIPPNNSGGGHGGRRGISITSPAEGQVLNTSPITVNGTAPDNVTLSKIEVKVGAGSWFTATIDNGSWTVSNISLITEKNNITARATDTSNNYTETSVNVTYTPLVDTPPSRKGGSGGSSGGGGGGGSGEINSNIDVNEKYDLPIYKDRMTTYTFKSVKNPIIYLNITGNTNNDVITAMVEALKGTSSLVTSAAPGNVYRNVNVWVGTSGFATPRNIKEAIIRFRVENSWISSNDDIKLLRWDGSNWITLKTSEITKDDTFTYFEANTDSFSSFAITSLKETPTLMEGIFSSEKTPSEKGAKAGVNKTKVNKPEGNTSNLLTNWFIIGGIFVLVGLIIEVLKMKKK